jgi:hypothetical protein
MALTTGAVTDRLLGATKMATASLRPVWAVTGNTVQHRGDLGRRGVPIDLDPRTEHPEDRTFRRGDLLGYVRTQRERLVIAARRISCARRGFAADAPPRIPPWRPGLGTRSQCPRDAGRPARTDAAHLVRPDGSASCPAEPSQAMARQSAARAPAALPRHPGTGVGNSVVWAAIGQQPTDRSCKYVRAVSGQFPSADQDWPVGRR